MRLIELLVVQLFVVLLFYRDVVLPVVACLLLLALVIPLVIPLVIAVCTLLLPLLPPLLFSSLLFSSLLLSTLLLSTLSPEACTVPVIIVPPVPIVVFQRRESQSGSHQVLLAPLHLLPLGFQGVLRIGSCARPARLPHIPLGVLATAKVASGVKTGAEVMTPIAVSLLLDLVPCTNEWTSATRQRELEREI